MPNGLRCTNVRVYARLRAIVVLVSCSTLMVDERLASLLRNEAIEAHTRQFDLHRRCEERSDPEAACPGGS